ncbi:MAG: hypothetical protein IJC94_08270 [Oscillospiraceae bacterium]|nr:hypothetical protein [Oscillospiraceae bacterium]
MCEKKCFVFGEAGFEKDILWKKLADYVADNLKKAGFNDVVTDVGELAESEFAAAVSSEYPFADVECVAKALDALQSGSKEAVVFVTSAGEIAAAAAKTTELAAVLKGEVSADAVKTDWQKVSTAKELFEAAQKVNGEVLEQLLEKGVKLLSKDGVMVSPDAEIGAGTEILPGTIIKSGVKIGENCVIGPNSLIENSEIGDGCTVNASQIYSSTVKDGVKIGPFSHIRPNCVVESGVKIGDFVELKNSNIGENTSVAHLTYIGDSDVGAKVNFGCGCVTVNYDGTKKSRTTVGDRVFVGCNTNLVAPVTVEADSYIAAGSTITEEVPSGALAIARARQVNKAGWVEKRKNKK